MDLLVAEPACQTQLVVAIRVRGDGDLISPAALSVVKRLVGAEQKREHARVHVRSREPG